jgi:hypothetical protein
MRWLTGLFVLGFLVTLSRNMEADCDRPRDVAVALTRATVVFRGIARQVKTIEDRGYRNITPKGIVIDGRDPWRGWIVTFTVFSVWKGAVGRDFTLHVTAFSEDDAYEDFKQGEHYVVFAEVNAPPKSKRFGVKGATYGAHGCGGTGRVSQSAVYLRQLGPGRPVS